MSEARTWDITGRGVPVKVLVAAVMLTCSALFGLDRLMDARINARLEPLSQGMLALQGQQAELLKVVQGLREDMIRYQAREKLAREKQRGE